MHALRQKRRRRAACTLLGALRNGGERERPLGISFWSCGSADGVAARILILLVDNSGAGRVQITRQRTERSSIQDSSLVDATNRGPFVRKRFGACGLCVYARASKTWGGGSHSRLFKPSTGEQRSAAPKRDRKNLLRGLVVYAQLTVTAVWRNAVIKNSRASSLQSIPRQARIPLQSRTAKQTVVGGAASPRTAASTDAAARCATESDPAPTKSPGQRRRAAAGAAAGAAAPPSSGT